MKKLIIKIPVLILISLVWFSCSDDDDGEGNTEQPNANQITQFAQDGTWRVASFIDSGEDETSDFAGYTFVFGIDGTLVAEDGVNAVTGTWSVTNSSSGTDFTIFFPVSDESDFEDLNDDWDVIEASATEISLEDVSGGNGGTDTLIFRKN
jgi:hypothetical protein